MGLLFFYIFVYLYYPMKFERKFLKGPPLAPPPVLKNQAPPAEKKIGPPPLGFWSSSTYAQGPLFRFTTNISPQITNHVRGT